MFQVKKNLNNFKIFNATHIQKLCFTQISTIIYRDRGLVASDLFHMFTQSIKFYSLNSPILKGTDV